MNQLIMSAKGGKKFLLLFLILSAVFILNSTCQASGYDIVLEKFTITSRLQPGVFYLKDSSDTTYSLWVNDQCDSDGFEPQDILTIQYATGSRPTGGSQIITLTKDNSLIRSLNNCTVDLIGQIWTSAGTIIDNMSADRRLVINDTDFFEAPMNFDYDADCLSSLLTVGKSFKLQYVDTYTAAIQYVYLFDNDKFFCLGSYPRRIDWHVVSPYTCNYVYGQNVKSYSVKSYNDYCYCEEGYQAVVSVDSQSCQKNENSPLWTLYERPFDSKILMPTVTNYYIGNYGKKVYTDRPNPLVIVGAMVKGETDPATYIVDVGGVLRWLKTEAVADRLFGSQWDSYITWFNDSIIYTYQLGEPIDR